MKPTDFLIIGRANCPWCDKAKLLLTLNERPYTYQQMAMPELKAFFEKHPELPRTVPQVWKDLRHIGGYNDLVAYLTD